MKIITLCGSTKFKKEFEQVQKKESLKGNLVISLGIFSHYDEIPLSNKTLNMLIQVHFKKIDLSDEIYIINPGGYIGISTCDEIYYAISTHKKIRWLETPNCWEKFNIIEA